MTTRKSVKSLPVHDTTMMTMMSIYPLPRRRGVSADVLDWLFSCIFFMGIYGSHLVVLCSFALFSQYKLVYKDSISCHSTLISLCLCKFQSAFIYSFITWGGITQAQYYK